MARPRFPLLILVGALLFLPRMGTAQLTEDLSGTWSGLLLQNEGGFADRFELYFDLEQIGLSVKGTAFVKLGELQAEMRLSGYRTLAGNWRLTETTILRNNKAGLAVSWCMKEYDLQVSYRDGEMILSGPWWGNSEYGPCVPGSITLRRKVKVAGLLPVFGSQYAIDVQPHGHVHHGDYALDGGLSVGRDEHAVAGARPAA